MMHIFYKCGNPNPEFSWNKSAQQMADEAGKEAKPNEVEQEVETEGDDDEVETDDDEVELDDVEDEAIE